MPYILSDKRLELFWRATKTPGELNFIVTRACIAYLTARDETYQTYNDIIGALECAKLEMYRRRIASYEDQKIIENGDLEGYQRDSKTGVGIAPDFLSRPNVEELGQTGPTVRRDGSQQPHYFQSANCACSYCEARNDFK